MSNSISVSIVTLCKENLSEVYSTFSSVLDQDFGGYISWLLIDGSSSNTIRNSCTFIESALSRCDNIFLNYFSAYAHGVHGIYPSFNFSSRYVDGDYVLYLNSGDTFYSRESLSALCSAVPDSLQLPTCVFGQALISSPVGIRWLFPNCIDSGIEFWLGLHEPNHQAMLVSSTIVRSLPYDESLSVSADKSWKRSLLNASTHIVYVPQPVCVFAIGGASSSPKPFSIVFQEILSNSLPISSKMATILKAFIPPRIFRFYPFLMFFKNFLTGVVISSGLFNWCLPSVPCSVFHHTE